MSKFIQLDMSSTASKRSKGQAKRRQQLRSQNSEGSLRRKNRAESPIRSEPAEVEAFEGSGGPECLPFNNNDQGITDGSPNLENLMPDISSDKLQRPALECDPSYASPNATEYADETPFQMPRGYEVQIRARTESATTEAKEYLGKLGQPHSLRAQELFGDCLGFLVSRPSLRPIFSLSNSVRKVYACIITIRLPHIHIIGRETTRQALARAMLSLDSSQQSSSCDSLIISKMHGVMKELKTVLQRHGALCELRRTRMEACQMSYNNLEGGKVHTQRYRETIPSSKSAIEPLNLDINEINKESERAFEEYKLWKRKWKSLDVEVYQEIERKEESLRLMLTCHRVAKSTASK